MASEKSNNNGIVQPHEHDVLSGKGRTLQEHAGNEYFRWRVRMHKVNYLKCRKRQKVQFSKMIVDEIKNRNPPGRFLKQDEATKLWYDIGEKRAVEKTMQALREDAPELKKIIRTAQKQQNRIGNASVAAAGLATTSPAFYAGGGFQLPVRNHYSNISRRLLQQQQNMMMRNASVAAATGLATTTTTTSPAFYAGGNTFQSPVPQGVMNNNIIMRNDNHSNISSFIRQQNMRIGNESVAGNNNLLSARQRMNRGLASNNNNNMGHNNNNRSQLPAPQEVPPATDEQIQSPNDDDAHPPAKKSI